MKLLKSTLAAERDRPRLVAFLCLLSLFSLARAIGGGNTVTIPRSTHRSEDSPPWNPSSLIDDDGFLLEKYHRCPGEWEEEANIGGKHGPRSRRCQQLEKVPVQIRQVPGDGNCLFHSIATCLSYAVHGTHICMKDTSELRKQSKDLRQRAVDGLESRAKLLFLQGHEYLRAKDLVEAAASQYGLSGERYCELMRQDSYWGGGPEIVALCNVLRRPIHVYELHSHQKQFMLRRMACFGSPKFDRREPLHILSADSRFPDVTPGKQLDSGNHFLAVFPVSKSVGRKAGVRGGDNIICKEESHGRWKLATWVALWWTTFSAFWTKSKGI